MNLYLRIRKLIILILIVIIFTGCSLSGDYYYSKKNYDKAYIAYNKSFLAKPENDKRKYDLAKTLLSQKKYDDALVLYLELLEKENINTQVYSDLSQIYYYYEDYESALKYIKKAIAKNPKKEDYYYNESLSYSGLNNTQDALISIDKALEINSDAKYLLFRKAELLTETRAYEQALVVYDVLIKVNPKDDIFLNNKAYVFSLLGRNTEALALYDLAIKYSPKDPINYLNKGDSLFTMKLYEEAINTYKQAIPLNEDNDYIYLAILHTMFALGKYKETIDYANEQNERNPSNENFLVWKSKALTKLGLIDEAKELCLIVLDINPNNHLALDELGYLYYLDGYYKEALNNINKAISIHPYDITYFYDKIMTIFEMKDYERAINESELTENLFGMTNFTLKYKIYSYNEIGDFQKGLNQAENLRLLDPTNPETFLYIAKQFLLLQNYDDAKINIDNALELDPYYVEAKLYLKHIEAESLPLKNKVVNFIRENYLYNKTLEKKEKIINDFLEKEEITQLDIIEFVESFKDDRDYHTFFIPDSLYTFYKNDESNIESKYIDTSVFYIKINLFNEKSVPQFWNAIREIKSTKDTTLVIDLRDNLGGTLKSGYDIIDILLPESYFAYTIDNTGYVNPLYSSPFYIEFKNIYFFVNDKTASTSELLVLSLREFLDNVKVIGLPTFGKGVGQKVLEDIHSKYLFYLVSFYWNVKEKNLEQNNIIPDLQITKDQEILYFNKLTNDLLEN